MTVTANEQLFIETRLLHACYRFSEVIEKCMPAAEEGDALAQYMVGEAYRFIEEDGRGEKAKKWFVRAVESLKAASAQGNIQANYLLGECYRYHKGVEMDNREAMKWYAKAIEGYTPLAEKGDAEAQFMLGHCYYREKGAKTDKDKSFAYFQSAALQGHPLAEYMLACCYIFGHGVEVDDEKIMYWLRKAVAHGIVEAMNDIGFYCFYGRAEEGQGYPEAVYWFEKAIELGNDESDTLELLATCYWKGLGTEKNIPKAIEYLEILCVRGYRSARDMLDEIGDEGYEEAYAAIDRSWDEW